MSEIVMYFTRGYNELENHNQNLLKDESYAIIFIMVKEYKLNLIQHVCLMVYMYILICRNLVFLLLRDCYQSSCGDRLFAKLI